MVTVSPSRAALIVTCCAGPANATTDQSDTSLVTTADICCWPSTSSMPLLIQFRSSIRSAMPAWSYCSA